MNKQILLLCAAAAGAYGYWIPSLVLLILAFAGGSDAVIDHKKVIKLEEETDFSKHAEGKGLTIVDFFTTWCPPCKSLAPKLADMSEEFPNVTFVAVDAEKFRSIAAKFNVKCYPTLVFLVDGKKVGVVEGADTGKIRDFIQTYEN